MPELPEVETIVGQLNQSLAGKTITQLKIFDSMVDDNILKILPSKIHNVKRRGKSIIFSLDKDQFILIHLRMTGHFHFVKGDLPAYTVALFDFDDNTQLTHNSIRKFGSLTLHNGDSLQEKLSKLGPEPLEMSAKEFNQLIKKFPNSNIKTKVLDQSFIAGIGNIYIQEAMYHAGIHPNRAVKEVSSFSKLFNELQKVLKLSIKNNGTTIQNFSHIDGKGNFQNLLAIYGKSHCPKGHATQKVKIGGRGTWYCDKCQW